MSCFSAVPKEWQDTCEKAGQKYTERINTNNKEMEKARKEKEVQKNMQKLNEVLNQQQQESQKLQKAVKQKEQAAEIECMAEKQKVQALELIQQGQQLLQKASKSSTKAAKEKDAANLVIEKVQTKVVQKMVKTVAKKLVSSESPTEIIDAGPGSSGTQSNLEGSPNNPSSKESAKNTLDQNKESKGMKKTLGKRKAVQLSGGQQAVSKRKK
jgi:hypothetical protein